MLAGTPRIKYTTATDGYRFGVRVWEVERPLARLVLLHGIVSHGGWYLRSCRYLAGAGFEVHALDRRGSGLNLQGRGDVEDHLTWVHDVETYVAGLPAGVPNILLGISWGGKLAAVLAKQRADMFSAVGLLFPGIYARQFPGWSKYTAMTMAAAAGLGKLQVPVPLQDPALFTSSAYWQRYVRDDPLTLRSVTIRFALEDRRLTRAARQSAGSIQIPVLLALAGRDRMVDNRLMRDFYEQIPVAGKTLLEYPEASHTVEFEQVPSAYFADLARWAERVANRSSG